MKKYNSIQPGKPWFDTNGNRIQAHGGSVIYLDGVYYFYGENNFRCRLYFCTGFNYGYRYYPRTYHGSLFPLDSYCGNLSDYRQPAHIIFRFNRNQNKS